MSDNIYIAEGIGNLFGAGLVGLGLYAHVDPFYSKYFLLTLPTRIIATVITVADTITHRGKTFRNRHSR